MCCFGRLVSLVVLDDQFGFGVGTVDSLVSSIYLFFES